MSQRNLDSSPFDRVQRDNHTNTNQDKARSDRPTSLPAAGSGSGSGSRTSTNAGGQAGARPSSTRTRPANAVLPGTTRPKTMYQAVTWKENLDAFNRRLRRGSLSLDAAAQEEELASQAAVSRSKPQQQQQQRQQHQQSIADQGVSSAGMDENTRLLGSTKGTPDQIHESDTLHTRAYGATPPTTSAGNTHRGGPSQNRGRDSDEPAFPTQLNPALATTKSTKLTTFSGVFIPCVLSIWGIILFLRFGFIISQAGVVGTLAMFIVGYMVDILTTFSLSAISTNGTVRGGGPYYLISRSLGPEFGGSIGLIFFFGTVLGCGMNVLGFVEPLISNFGESSGTVFRILPEGQVWSFIYGTMLLVSCTLVCLVGSKLFSRASLVLAVIILLSTLSIFVSFATMPAFSIPERNIEYTGFSLETLKENLWPRFTVTTGPDGSRESFQSVFGVLFPACIGILAGTSMSGDLQDPSKSIPKGTLWAVGTTFCAYTSIVVMMGGCISRSTMYTDLSVLQDVSRSPMFIASGALAASVFATLGAVIGAAKILQAIARDNLLPILTIFGQGTPKTDEPTLAVLLTYILCQMCLFLTNINSIATFVSLTTLLTFLIINLACFLLKIGSAPNFRPSFRFFHWWTAFGGMLLCAIVMGFVDLGKSMLSGLMVAAMFIWIHYWSPPKRWGDVTQSLIYHQVRKYLLRLDSRKEHVKFWRPQILLLVHHPRSEYHLIQFCNHLKKGALYVLGHVILGDLRDVLAEYRRQQVSWLKFVDVLQIKAFVNLSVADSVRIGARNLLIGTGLGGMRPNIVVMGSFNVDRYLREKQQQQQLLLSPQHPHSPAMRHKVQAAPIGQVHHQDHTLLNIPSLPIDNIRVEQPIQITDYVSIIEDVLSLNKAVAIGYGFDRLELPEENIKSWKLFNFGNFGSPSSLFSSTASSLHKHGEAKEKKYIDLWPMQMSVAPLHCGPGLQPSLNKRTSRDMSSYSPMLSAASGGAVFTDMHGHTTHVPRVPEANLTNFDTYTMVLQMGCILHMVPHWKENYWLRVMVFVEYKDDVEEEGKRIEALLENLRIPAEVKVMCLDGSDSATYDRLVKGDGLSAPSESMLVTQEDSQEVLSPSQGPRNMHPSWRASTGAVLEEDETESENEGTLGESKDGQHSSHETGPYLDFGREGQSSRHVRGASAGTAQPRPQQAATHASVQHPQRRRTFSHSDQPSQGSGSGLRITTALSPRTRQGAPMTVASAQPSSQHYASSSGGMRYRSTGNAMSPVESRLGTSVPLGASMNFRIAVPLPRQYFDPNGINSESDSDSMSSEDDEDYDHNDHDLVYGGSHPQGSQSHHPPHHQHHSHHQHALQHRGTLGHLPGATGSPQVHPAVHSSVGSEPGLGIALGMPTVHEQEALGREPLSGSNPWATVPDGPQFTGSPATLQGSNMVGGRTDAISSQAMSNSPVSASGWDQGTRQGGGDGSLDQDIPAYTLSSPRMAPLLATGGNTDVTLYPSSFGSSHPPPSPTFIHEVGPNGTTSSLPLGTPPPIQFDHLAPEDQLQILNELMRIHSSPETTSIVFTTVPAPEEGTCLREENSLAYLESLDRLMDGIEIPVLLIHAKSLTVTMTL